MARPWYIPDPSAYNEGPVGIAVTVDAIFCSFYTMGYIRKYALDFTPQNSFGSIGTGNGQFQAAFGLAVDANYLYATDALTNKIQVFNFTGVFVASFALNNPIGEGRGIAVDADNIYVVDGQAGTVEKFNKSFTHQTTFSAGTEPFGVTIYNGVISIADIGGDVIRQYSTSGVFGGYVGDTIPSYESGHFQSPTDVHSDNTGYFVFDAGNSRVQTFSTDAEYSCQADAPSILGALFLAVDVAYIYLADTENKRIMRYCKNVIINGNVVDVFPPVITRDMLINDLYGLGLNPDCWNDSAALETCLYCQDNDILLSVILDSQQSVLDYMQYIISHHEGFITYLNGLISHRQLKMENPIKTLTHDDLVKEPGTLPVESTTKGSRDYKNSVTVQYTKRASDYVAGTVGVGNPIDIDKFGVLDITLKMDGLCTFFRALKMAYRSLRKLMYMGQTYAFKLGPNNMDVRPGQVYNYFDPTMDADNVLIRIGAVSEQKDFQIVIEAIEDNSLVNTFINPPNIITTSLTSLVISTGTKVLVVEAGLGFVPGQIVNVSQAGNSSNYMYGTVTEYEGTSLTIEVYAIGGSGTYAEWVIYYQMDAPPIPPAYIAPPGSVIHPMAAIIPSMYVAPSNLIGVAFSKSANEAWAGASLYRAYATGGPYTLMDSRATSGVTGEVVSWNTETEPYFDLLLDSDYSLPSAASFEILQATPMMNLFVVRTSNGDKFCRYQTAELLDVRTWRLSGIIYDEPDTNVPHSIGDIIVGTLFALFTTTVFRYTILPVDAGLTLYFKVASYNHAGTSEDLGSVTAISIDVPA